MPKTLFSTTLALMLLTTSALAQDFDRIDSEPEFRALALDKTLYLGDTQVTVHDKGAMTVVFKGKEITGTWQWEDGFFCRILKSYSTKADCQLWEYDGTDFRIARDKGNGQAFVYTVQPE
ncbi:hypothetical protein [Pelagimonas varians]|uniref:Dihydrodipicolinate reductase n=1 Tax=Pelagimonas varians TaxID=696760 RepID=A0A238KW97_9RHOB|nr:hypothetical protein [Pelagimonas varians]PYG28264.1 hypothetical protein C8N36_11238 [Pelagimonas varians]SMX46346.1 hypothetical protein PEV8663_03240 [Pelagimonas varians]